MCKQGHGGGLNNVNISLVPTLDNVIFQHLYASQQVLL